MLIVGDLDILIQEDGNAKSPKIHEKHLLMECSTVKYNLSNNNINDTPIFINLQQCHSSVKATFLIHY